jgi:hypothetical protein
MDQETFNKMEEQTMKQVIKKFTLTLHPLKSLPSNISSRNS